MVSERPIRVLVVDDHPLVRAGLRMLIDSDPRCVVVAEAGDRLQALSAAAIVKADIVVLDLHLGSEYATDFLPELLATAGGARVLIVTGLRDETMHQESLRRGASGIVLKDQAAGSLVETILRIHDGESGPSGRASDD